MFKLEVVVPIAAMTLPFCLVLSAVFSVGYPERLLFSCVLNDCFASLWLLWVQVCSEKSSLWGVEYEYVVGIQVFLISSTVLLSCLLNLRCCFTGPGRFLLCSSFLRPWLGWKEGVVVNFLCGLSFSHWWWGLLILNCEAVTMDYSCLSLPSFLRLMLF